MPSLFLLRHGKTQWTEEKRFAGWGNAPLSATGLDEAYTASKILKKSGHTFDACFTSCLTRAQHTSQIVLDELAIPLDKLEYNWRLNERHYGALQGELRSDMVRKYGASDVLKWRSNYHAQPPKLPDDGPRFQDQLDSFQNIPRDKHPRSESMVQAVQRTYPIWDEKIAPALKEGKTVLVIAHTNSIRSLVGGLENFNEAQSAAFRISTATPRHYELDDDLKPLKVRDLTNSPKAKIRHWAIRKRLQLIGSLPNS